MRPSESTSLSTVSKAAEGNSPLSSTPSGGIVSFSSLKGRRTVFDWSKSFISLAALS